MNRRTGYRLFIMFLVFIFLIGCSSQPASDQGADENGNAGKSGQEAAKEEPVRGGELVMGYATDASSFDPILGNAGSDHVLLYPIYDTLIRFDKDLQPQPGLAKSWEIEDEKTIVLHLQEGVVFHDGTPFDAEAVKFNLERANSEESRVSDLKNLESVEVVDPHTVKLHLKQPDSSIILALSDRTGMMVSPAAVKKYGKDYAQHPVGTGPFKLVSYQRNNEIRYEAFKDYWQKGLPYLEKLTVKIMPDENTRINALKSGQIDLSFPMSPANLASLEKDPSLVVESHPEVAYHKIYLNTTKPPFDNKKVRQALNYAIDREALVKAVSFGRAEPSYQPFPKGYWAHDPGITIPYDPEKAKQLLKEAGVGKVSFVMPYFPSGSYERLAQVIRGQLEKVGIEVQLQPMELTKGVSEYFQEKRHPSYLSRWTGRPDPQQTVSLIFSKDGYYNTGGQTTPELEELIKKAAATYEQEERAKLYAEIARIGILEEAMHIPLLSEPATAVMTKKVKGYQPNLLGKPNVSFLWIQK